MTEKSGHRLRIYQISATFDHCEADHFVVLAYNIKEARKFIRELAEKVSEQREDLKNPQIIACVCLGCIFRSQIGTLKAGIQPWTTKSGKWPALIAITPAT